MATQELTGGSSDYYKVRVTAPTSGGDAYTAECNDIIEALELNFAEGNILKALWRIAKARQGDGKPGNTIRYDAEKVEFFGKRVLAQTPPKPKHTYSDDCCCDMWTEARRAGQVMKTAAGIDPLEALAKEVARDL